MYTEWHYKISFRIRDGRKKRLFVNRNRKIDTLNDLILFILQDFSLDIFFRQAWKDERLDHGLNKTMFLSNFVMDRIWMPDSYFVNAKHGSFHKVTTNNMMIMIMPGGQVNYNAR